MNEFDTRNRGGLSLASSPQDNRSPGRRSPTIKAPPVCPSGPAGSDGRQQPPVGQCPMQTFFESSSLASPLRSSPTPGIPIVPSSTAGVPGTADHRNLRRVFRRPQSEWTVYDPIDETEYEGYQPIALLQMKLEPWSDLLGWHGITFDTFNTFEEFAEKDHLHWRSANDILAQLEAKPPGHFRNVKRWLIHAIENHEKQLLKIMNDMLAARSS